MLITDSHGRELSGLVTGTYKGWSVFSVIVGQKTSAIRSCYESRMAAAVLFQPDYVVLHCGHNDVVYHPRYTKEPEHIKHFFPDILDFMHLLSANHPQSRIIYSSLLPRGIGPYMCKEDKDKYNKLACRFGVRATTSCGHAGFQVLQNFCMWKSVRKSTEDPTMLDEGGLHLSTLGRKSLVNFWISTISNDY
jgi:hypothetical protein